MFRQIILFTLILFGQGADAAVREACAANGTVLYYYSGEMQPMPSKSTLLGKLRLTMTQAVDNEREIHLGGITMNVTCLASRLITQKTVSLAKETIDLTRTKTSKNLCMVMHVWYAQTIIRGDLVSFGDEVTRRMASLSCTELHDLYLAAHQLGCVPGITAVLARCYVEKKRVPCINQERWVVMAAALDYDVLPFAERDSVMQAELAAAAAALPRVLHAGDSGLVLRATQQAQSKGATPSNPWQEYTSMSLRKVSLCEWARAIAGTAVVGKVATYVTSSVGDPRVRVASALVVGVIGLYALCRYIQKENRILDDERRLGYAREAVLRSVFLATDTYLTTLTSLVVLLYDPDGYRRLMVDGLRLASDQEMIVSYTAASPEDLCAQLMAVLCTPIDDLVAMYHPDETPATRELAAATLPGAAGGVGRALEDIIAICADGRVATPVGVHTLLRGRVTVLDERLKELRGYFITLIDQYRHLMAAMSNGWQQMVYAVDALLPALCEGRTLLGRY